MSAYKAVYIIPKKLGKGEVDAVWLEPYETYDFYVGRNIPRIPGYDDDIHFNTPITKYYGDLDTEEEEDDQDTEDTDIIDLISGAGGAGGGGGGGKKRKRPPVPMHLPAEEQARALQQQGAAGGGGGGGVGGPKKKIGHRPPQVHHPPPKHHQMRLPVGEDQSEATLSNQ